MNIIDPVFFSLQRKGRTLFYLGIRHSWDAKDSQYEFINKKWDEIISLAKNPLAIVECIPGEICETKEESILKSGEIGFIGFLAKRDGIPMVCLEPSRNKEMNYLLNFFAKEQVEYYYFGRAVNQWQRLIKKPSIEEYLIPFLKRDKNASGWNDFEFSIENMKKVHKKLFSTEMDFNDVGHFSRVADPTKEDNILKEVVRASGDYRNKAIIDGIKNAWKDKDIFVVYGRGHAVAHQKALENKI